ncbi:hypothetical protein M569_12783, partial [Genlisea aurea]
MDQISAAEERLFNEKLRRKLNEVNAAAQLHLSDVNDHINFTLQKAYFKCAYDCFDRKNKQEEINSCVEHCSVPVLNAQNFVETEMGKFQEKLNRSLRVCQDKYESARLQGDNNNGLKDMESCVDSSIQSSIKTIPHLADKFKEYLSIK